MTEAEWLACTDPQPMLKFLQGKASDRKLRMFACACCRRVWRLLPDQPARDAVEVAERFADGLVADQGRSDARKAAQRAAQSRAVTPRPDTPKWKRRAASAVYYATARDAMEAAWNAPQLAVEALFWQMGGYAASESHPIRECEQSTQAETLRDIFGNPFRVVKVDSRRLTSTVVGLARAVYDERAFDRLPILADALEDAGCTDAALLGHCRGGGEHVRGCWVVDLLLGLS